MKTGLIVRHVPYEGIAAYREPIEAAGYALDRFDVTDPGFPQLDFTAPDLLILMGGPMAVYERDEHPWIGCEIERLAMRLEQGLPTLGVCLGAQMIAAALGARVYGGSVKEVGFAPVTLHGDDTPLRHVRDVPVLHWHGDTFDLPAGTELLASSAHYANQAFRRGPELLALQFHAEMGEDPRFEAWLENEAYIAEAGTSVAELRAAHDVLGSGAVTAGQAMIAEWLRGL